MGVPKFYRWISERYPCLSEVVKENQIPEFDNLYLDMNGIIHTCSHPNDEDVHFRMPEEKMFKDIFHYIEVLFRIIRPRKVFFMAVDGVAPRAKMNQQRGRRFRSAKEAITREKEAISKGEVLPKEKRFDSNCITPGTEFMVRLQKQLVYFVNQKITNDRLWQGVRVYLSGHETPGEGEHKIMDFIRSEKCREGYDPNTRHCLYGLDADLIMLGLVSHEPHFSLLREEVRFGRQAQAQRPTTPEETTFHLLHLSLLREYLAEEFVELKSLPWFDIESIIDDWVMMGFLVGNDFIPNLPNMHINHGALPQLYRIYIKLLPSLNGYINNGGVLHLRRFETFLRALSKHDEDAFKQSMEEFDYLTSKSSKEAWKSQRVQKKIEEKEMRRKLAEQNMILQHAIDYGAKKGRLEHDDDNDSVDSLAEELKKSGLQIMDLSEGSDEDCDTSALELKMKKRQYYREKLEKDFVSDEEVKVLAIEYVRAVQWILHYYYNGCQSWSWFYPFHYAPYVSDISGFSNMRFEYDFSRPFLPFQQLLAVLPAASKELLPAAYQGLMIQESSPIIDYYPEDFEEDLNGKQQSWEAVVKIPFIDEKRLLAAMAQQDQYLKDAERKRNTHSEHLLYMYSPDVKVRIPSSLPGHFPDISCSHAKLTKIPLNQFWVPKERLKKGLCEGVKLGVYYPGFPTLYHLKFESELRKDDVKVFQQNSRGDNMILKVINTTTTKSADSIYRDLLGKSIYAEWPHMKEVRIVAVSDDLKRYELVEGGRSPNQRGSGTSMRCIDLSGDEVEKFYNVDLAGIDSHYHKRKGVIIGKTSVLVYGCPLLGRKYICGNGGVISLEKQWAPTPQAFAYQMTVKDIMVHDTSFKQFKTLGEVFPKNTECFMLGNPHYGAMGKVLETREDKVTVQFVVPPDPDFHHIMRREEQYQMQYYPAHVLAKKLAVSSHLVSRITGTIFVSKGPPPSNGADMDAKSGSRINIGLNLKFNKTGEEVPGYTRKEEEGAPWKYSSKLLDVLREYIMGFPEVFEVLAGARSQSDVFYETDVFGDSPTRLKELKEWLSEVECTKVPKAKCGQLALDEPVIKMVEEEVAKASLGRSKKVKMSVRPHLLHRPFDYQGNLVPDPQAAYQLYDRVINVREGYSVPLGLKGVIVGIQDGPSILDKVYEVVFDEGFVGGLKLRCSGHRAYRLTASALINISYGLRKTLRGTQEKPLAVVKPQQNEVRFFDPTSSAPHTQQQQWYANKISSLGSRSRVSEGTPSNPLQTTRREPERTEQRQDNRRQVRNEPPEEQPTIPTPPSFASMVKPGGPQTNSQKAQPSGTDDAKTGPLKYTILSRKDEKSGKQGGVLRKRERLVKRSSSGTNMTSQAEAPSEESSTSSEPLMTSPEHSVSSPTSKGKSRDLEPIRRDPDRSSPDKMNELWEKLKVGEGQGGMPADCGQEIVVVGGRLSDMRDPWRNEDPPSAEDVSNSASIQGEGDSSELLSPDEVWDEESDSVHEDLPEEERMTPNTLAKNETKEKLCQLLNLSHITGGNSPLSGELHSPTLGAQAPTGLPPGKKISVEELLESSLSAALKPSFNDAPPNPPPGFAPLGGFDNEKMPLPPNTNQLFPVCGSQSNPFPGSVKQPLGSPPGRPLGPAQLGSILAHSTLVGPQHPGKGPAMVPVQRSVAQLPEKSAFEPVLPHQAQNANQTIRFPPGFMTPPKQYPQGAQGMRQGSMGMPVMMNPGMGMGPFRPNMSVPPPNAAAQFQQFHGQRPPPPPGNSFQNMVRQHGPAISGMNHPPGMPHPPPGLPNRTQQIGPARTYGLQDPQMMKSPTSKMAPHSGFSFPNMPQSGPNKMMGPQGPAVNSSLGRGQQLPQPIGHQLNQPGSSNTMMSSNPLGLNPAVPERLRSPPGQPGYPPIPPIVETLMNLSGTGSGASNTPSGQPMDTMLNKLRAFCDSKGLRHPNYEYIDTDIIGEYFVIIYLPTGQIIRGERCNGRRNALELAAFKALQIMRSCPEATEYQGQPPTQFVPLQVTKKLTPRKTSNPEDIVDPAISLPPPLGDPQTGVNPLGNIPLGGTIPHHQSLFDGQSIFSAAVGMNEPLTVPQPLAPTQPIGPTQAAVPATSPLEVSSLQDLTIDRSTDRMMEEQLLGTLLSENQPDNIPQVMAEVKVHPQGQPSPGPSADQEQPQLRTGTEESQVKSPVPRAAGGARTRGRRQGAKGGAKLAINFGGSG